MATATTTAKALTALAPTTPAAIVKMAPSSASKSKGKVTFAELEKHRFPRKCIYMYEALHWPSLFFPNYEVMVEELGELENVIFELESLNDMGMQLMEAMEENDQANTQPVVLLLGLNELMFAPSEDDIVRFEKGVSKMLFEGKQYPDLDEAINLAKKLNKHCKGPTGRKRKALRRKPSPPKSAAAAPATSVKPAASVPSVTPAPGIVTTTTDISVKPALAPVLADATLKPAPVLATPKTSDVAILPASAPVATDTSVKPPPVLATPKPSDDAEASMKPTPAPALAETSVVKPAPVLATPKPTDGADTAAAAKPKEDKAQPKPSGQELLEEANKINVGVGPLMLSPQNSTTKKDQIPPAEYKCLQGGPTVQDFAASLGAKKASAEEKSNKADSVLPTEYRKFQGGQTVEEYAAACELNEAKKAEQSAASNSENASAAGSSGTVVAVDTQATASETTKTPVPRNKTHLSTTQDDPMEVCENTDKAVPATEVRDDATVQEKSVQNGKPKRNKSGKKKTSKTPTISKTPKRTSSVDRPKTRTAVKVTKKTSTTPGIRKTPKRTCSVGRPRKKTSTTPGISKTPKHTVVRLKNRSNRRVKPSPPTSTLDVSDSPFVTSDERKPNMAKKLSDAERLIPTFDEDIKSELKRLRFKLANTKSFENEPVFCYPGYNRQNGTLGETYFTSLEAFRARLCSHGLGELSEQEKFSLSSGGTKVDKLERWIRLSIVKNLPEDMVSLENPLETWKSRIPLLKVLGFSMNDGYSFRLGNEIDNVWRSTEFGCINEPDEADFMNRLSRFGFPQECHFEKLVGDERMLLELDLSFEDRDWINPEPLKGFKEFQQKGRGARANKRGASQTVENKVENKAKKARKGRSSKAASAQTTPVPMQTKVVHTSKSADTPVPMQQRESPVATAQSALVEVQQKKPATKNKAASPPSGKLAAGRRKSAPVHQRTTVSAQSMLSPTICDKSALADCNSKPTGEESTKKNLSGRDISAEIETSNNVARLDSCLENLEDDMMDDEGTSIVFGSDDSHFRKNSTDCYLILEKLVRSRVLEKSDLKTSPASLYVCGSPGIGKTTAANWSCRKAMRLFTDGEFNHLGIEPALVEINCTQLEGLTNVRSKILGDIWEACNASDRSKKCNEKSLMKMIASNNAGDKKRFVILVLDEIDQLVSANIESENPRTNGEKLIKELNALSSDSSLRFAVIGIGNAMNNNKYRRITQFMKFHESFSFQAYCEDEIASILRGRVEGAKLVEPKALTLIAKKTSNVKGDARQALEMLRTLLRNAKQQAEVEANAAQGPYLVKMRDVVRLNTDYAKLATLIKDIPLVGQLVVVAAVKLANQNHSTGSTIQLTRQDLIDASSAVIQEKLRDTVDTSDINDRINELNDIGVAHIETQFGCNPADPVVFNHLPSELDAAAEAALGEWGIFDV